MKTFVNYSKKSALVLALFLTSFLPVGVAAHHSFAIFDFDTEIEFEGQVETLSFRNPHMAMTLKLEDGTIIDFIEGAPANMLARSGLKPDMIKVGTTIKTVGSPLIEDNSKYFLRKIILADGSEF